MKKIVSIIVTLAFCSLLSITIVASSPSYTVHMLGNTSIWFGGYPVTRSTNYNYVSIRVNSIHPTNSGVDNNRYVHACVKTTNEIKISDTILLTEGTGYKNITLYNGYLNQSEVDLYFKNYYTIPVTMEIDCRGN